MGKRRERDRPKAGPDAAYDPNKRILLSYGDSDDDTEVPEQQHVLGPRAYVRATSSQTEAEAATNAEAAVGDATIGEKNKSYNDPKLPRKDEVDNDDDAYDPEEGVTIEIEDDIVETVPERTNPHPGRNPATNQKPALGSLSFQWDEADEEGYETAEDEAMAYLRAVRQERQSMPSVFRAADPDDDTNLYEMGDSRGYYDEDCYIARPLYGPGPPVKNTVAPREAYTSALKVRFKQLHNRLQQPPEAVRSTDVDTEPLVPQPQADNTAYAECLRLVRQAPPQPLQLQSMSQESVFATLELIDKHFLHRGKTIDRNTSAWTFALLARLDEVGSMDNDKVSMLRELGKRAVIVQISFNDAMAAAQLEGIGDSEDLQQDIPDDIAQPNNTSRAHEAGNKEETADNTAETEVESSTLTDKENTLATLDMILAIVGEIFGQRDLLEFRRSWEPDG